MAQKRLNIVSAILSVSQLIYEAIRKDAVKYILNPTESSEVIEKNLGNYLE